MRNSIIIFSFLLLLILGCKKEKSSQQRVGEYPGAVNLLSPQANETCLIGPVIGGKSVVTFVWSKDDHSDKYELVINDLKNGGLSSYETTDLKLDVGLPLNTPFSWYVRSKSSSNASSSQSSIWKFYTSGPGVVSYPPFPADQLIPEFKQAVTAVDGKITLSWVGAHVDNNILGYNIYLSEDVRDLSLIKADWRVSSLVINVRSNATYYWKVITKDTNGNQSDSGIYQFLVL